MMGDVNGILIDIFIDSLMFLRLNIQQPHLFLPIHEGLVNCRNVRTIAIVSSQSAGYPTTRTTFTAEIHGKCHSVFIFIQTMSPREFRLLLEIAQNTTQFALP